MSGIVRMQQDQLLLSKAMRKFIYIIFAAALFATSCEQEQQPIYPNGDLPIHRGYMQFSTDVSSRAQLATDMRGKSFGVLGYQYSSTTNWATAKPVTAPNTFYKLEVACADNGTCSYDAYTSDNDKSLKEWEEGNYSFFAYHPFNANGISLSSENTTNTPTLTYTYAWLNPTNQDSWFQSNFETMDNKGMVKKFDVVKLCDPNAPIYDVMTAEAIDVNGRGSGTVGLNFKHRMFALEVLANNYNETEYQVDDNGDFVLDADGNKIIVGKSATQSIDNLVLTLTGLQHSTMTIPMSMQSGEAAPIYGGTSPGTRSFLINEKKVVVPAFNETYEGRGEGIATSVSKLGGYNNNAGYIMLIPQTTGLSGTLHWNQLENFPGTISTNFTSNIEFKAGKLYQLYINYVGSGITIALIEAGAWDVHDVEHKFE